MKLAGQLKWVFDLMFRTYSTILAGKSHNNLLPMKLDPRSRVMSMMINDTVKVEAEKLLNCSSTTLPGTSDNLVHDKDGNSRQKR